METVPNTNEYEGGRQGFLENKAVPAFIGGVGVIMVGQEGVGEGRLLRGITADGHNADQESPGRLHVIVLACCFELYGDFPGIGDIVQRSAEFSANSFATVERQAVFALPSFVTILQLKIKNG